MTERPTAGERCENCNGTGFVSSMNPDIPIKPCPHGCVNGVITDIDLEDDK